MAVGLSDGARAEPARRGPAAARGSRTVKMLPRPVSSDADRPAHQLRQLLADRQAQAGALVASGGRAVDLAEGLEDRGLILLRDADAGVRTSNSTASRSSTTARTATRPTRPWWVNFSALSSRLVRTWKSRTGSPDDDPRARVDPRSHSSREPRLGAPAAAGRRRRPPPWRAGRTPSRCTETCPASIREKSRSLSTSDEQLRPGSVHLRPGARLDVVQRGVLQDLRGDEHGGQRRADLVAHVGQEHRLHLGGREGRVAGDLELRRQGLERRGRCEPARSRCRRARPASRRPARPRRRTSPSRTTGRTPRGRTGSHPHLAARAARPSRGRLIRDGAVGGRRASRRPATGRLVLHDAGVPRGPPPRRAPAGRGTRRAARRLPAAW